MECRQPKEKKSHDQDRRPLHRPAEGLVNTWGEGEGRHGEEGNDGGDGTPSKQASEQAAVKGVS